MCNFVYLSDILVISLQAKLDNVRSKVVHFRNVPPDAVEADVSRSLLIYELEVNYMLNLCRHDFGRCSGVVSMRVY